MGIEKGKISGRSLSMLVVCLIMGSILLTMYTYGVTKQDTWIVVLTGYIVFIPFILIYVSLAIKFRTKNLIQMNDIIYGKYLGKLISSLYIWYFLEITTLNLYNLGAFVNGLMMYETPLVVIYIVFILVCVWAVRGGIEVISRCCFIILAFTVIEITIMTGLLVKDMDFSNFLPVLDLPVLKYIQGTNIMFSIPYGEIIVFTMVMAYVTRESKLKGSVLIGFSVGTATLFVVVLRDTAVLGALAPLVTFQSFQAAALIELSKTFTRMEIIIAGTLLITIFIKICLFYYASVLGIAQLFRLKTYTHLVLPLGAVIVTYALFVFDSPMEQMFYASNVFWVYAIPYQIVFPLLSLVIAKVRGLPGGGGE